jgi:hypothetical protein
MLEALAFGNSELLAVLDGRGVQVAPDEAKAVTARLCPLRTKVPVFQRRPAEFALGVY